MKCDSRLHIIEALDRSVVESLAEMAFVDVIPADPADITVSHVIRIRYNGPDQGELVLHLPHACKRRIAENTYGMDWIQLHDSDIDDCLLELLNVIAGNFIQHHFGAETHNDLSLPELLFDDARLGDHQYIDRFFDAEGDLFKVSCRGTRTDQTDQGDVP